MRNAGVWAHKAAPFVLLWLALHAAVLALIVFAWGAAVLVKAMLGWLLHFAAFAMLVLTGAWLAMRLWKTLEIQRAV
ncbi:MAG: hypothetical protein JWN16_2751 [Alphaproteobacteria bacterium]|nr:hypothetical protein [Alphaproteobacteria bacterium]